jgi:5-methylcytosine-specific restriction endonuclease McrA
MVRRQISWKITSALSMPWHFTTKSGGIWFSLEDTWGGSEKRSGNADLREAVYARDGGRCGWCGWFVPWDEYQMDHIKPRHLFKQPAEADVMANLQVLHKFPCHEAKTKQELHAVAA